VRRGATLLLYGILAGEISIIQTCLDLGADVQNSDFLRCTIRRAHMMRHGYPSVFVAAVVGRVPVLELLCKDGAATPMLHDRWGRTPLHAAAALVQLGSILWLVDNTEIGRNCVDKDARRPVDYLPITASKDLYRLLTPLIVSHLRFSLREFGERSPNLQWCHCVGNHQCMCPDAFFERWYMDRANTLWLPPDVAVAITGLMPLNA